jgi:hypothetical protein
MFMQRSMDSYRRAAMERAMKVQKNDSAGDGEKDHLVAAADNTRTES